MNDIFLHIRIPQDLHELLKRVSKARGEDMSGFSRRAILKELASLSYLDADQKKALGVTTAATETAMDLNA